MLLKSKAVHSSGHFVPFCINTRFKTSRKYSNRSTSVLLDKVCGTVAVFFFFASSDVTLFKKNGNIFSEL